MLRILDMLPQKDRQDCPSIVNPSDKTIKMKGNIPSFPSDSGQCTVMKMDTTSEDETNSKFDCDLDYDIDTLLSDIVMKILDKWHDVIDQNVGNSLW